MDLKEDGIVVAGIAVAILGVLWWAKGKIANGAINPASQNNIANQAANGIWQEATGSNGSIGTDAFNATHNDDGSLNEAGYSLIYGPFAPVKAALDWLAAPSN